MAPDKGMAGADWRLKNTGHLPDYYISYEDAIPLGWNPREGNLAEAIPGKMIVRGIHKNKEGKLPQSPGRVWYEADINYTSGRRNAQRVLFSNDGLVFVTYNHYETFAEII